MVNEINQPKEITENAQLEQRLIASSHALLEMQAEHNQLMQSMEQLRERAGELQQMRFQQSSELQSSSTQSSSSKIQTKITEAIETKEEAIAEKSKESVQSEDGDKEAASEADYISQKLNEIALLKAQFKKVQNLVSTTEMIEKHLSQQTTSASNLNKEIVSEESEKSEITSTYECATSSKSHSLLTKTSSISTSTNQTSNEDSDDKRQLLNTMVDMFQDLSGDLKEQADNLRAERERIKALKEDIVRQKQQSKK
ncbi:uncharacterized protein ACN427_004299 [Glossina fuscipes fuscipes]